MQENANQTAQAEGHENNAEISHPPSPVPGSSPVPRLYVNPFHSGSALSKARKSSSNSRSSVTICGLLLSTVLVSFST